MVQSLDIGQNFDGGISNLRISVQSLIKENCHNSRTSDDIDMKLGPVTNLDKRNKTTSQKFELTSCWKIVTLLSFFQFIANLEQFGSGILDAQSAKLRFSLIATFYLTNTKSNVFAKKMLVFEKKCRHQQNLEGLSTKRYIF